MGTNRKIGPHPSFLTKRDRRGRARGRRITGERGSGTGENGGGGRRGGETAALRRTAAGGLGEGGKAGGGGFWGR